MNIILYRSLEIEEPNMLRLKDSRAEHIRTILRSKPGDTVRVGRINGAMGTATVCEISKSNVLLTVEPSGIIPPKPPTDIIVALPRPIMLKRVLTQAATFGVGRILLINAARVEKSFFNATLLEKENYQTFLRNGLEQAVDTMLPEVAVFKRFKPFIEDFFPTIAGQYKDCLVAHPFAQKFMFQATTPDADDKLLLAIGPEGGWVDYEIEQFLSKGFTPFSLGPRILRVDTVVPALLSQLDQLRAMQSANPAAS